MSKTNSNVVVEKEEEEKKDPHVCGCRCSIFSRVCGYYRPVENWNIGKKEEFKDRVLFAVPGARN